MKHWHQIPILLSLEHMEVSATTNKITIILLKCMVKYGGILCDEIGLRWVCLNCYRNFVFQEHYFQVTSQFKSKVVPFFY
jgi:transposase-like protein